MTPKGNNCYSSLTFHYIMITTCIKGNNPAYFHYSEYKMLSSPLALLKKMILHVLLIIFMKLLDIKWYCWNKYINIDVTKTKIIVSIKYFAKLMIHVSYVYSRTKYHVIHDTTIKSQRGPNHPKV